MNLVKAFKLLNPNLKTSSIFEVCPFYKKENNDIDIEKTIKTYFNYIDQYKLGRKLILSLYKGKLFCGISETLREIVFVGYKGEYKLIENGYGWFKWYENYEGEEFEELNKEIESIYNDTK